MASLIATEDELADLAGRAAMRCRRAVQACLREEEWLDADEAFAAEIAGVLDGIRIAGPVPAGGCTDELDCSVRGRPAPTGGRTGG